MTYCQVGDTYLAIMEFATKHGLALRGTETRALAFLMSTMSVGSLWFDGCLPASADESPENQL